MLPPAPGTTTPSTSSSAETTADLDTTASAESTGGLVCPATCDLSTPDCNDGRDNDGDGLIDLDDPECLTPCQLDEGSTSHAYPKGGADCYQDCFWDDNYGIGDDQCRKNTQCDPLDPEGRSGCPFTGALSCMDDPWVDEECLAACMPMTPPGCDCFGCCTIETSRGPQDRWMTDLDCTFADPDACAPCTRDTTCDNPCDEPCEWCFGEPGPPVGCDAPSCSSGIACADTCECPESFACMLGCCWPLDVAAALAGPP